MSATLTQMGATERTNRISLTAFVDFPDARNRTVKTCISVRHPSAQGSSS
jgi:hypothetical protein